MGAASKSAHTYADLVRLGDAHVELIRGVLIEKAAPTADHGRAQFRMGRALEPYDRTGGSGHGPGGWWFGTEIDIELGPHDVYRPDVAGWRRERLPTMPKEQPLRVRPDWVCEILSESNARQDLSTKLGAYHQFRVPHDWIVDPSRELLTVYFWREEGYVLSLTAGRDERVRAVPFDAIEIAVGVLFGDDPPDHGPPATTT